jgi:hypothetical protein
VNPASRSATLDATHTSVSGLDFTVLATSISGTVREGSTPVSGVTVLLFNAGSATTLATTTTNGSGVYSFPAIGEGSYELKANAPSGKVINPASRSATISGATPSLVSMDFTVSPTSIEGTVTESGSPVSGVTVTLYGAGSSSPISATTSNTSGVYRFDGMGAGSFDVKPTAPSGKVVSPTTRTVTVSASAPTATGQNFTLTGNSYPPGREYLSVPVPSNYIVTANGLDWVYVSPCSFPGCTAGIAVGKDGFQYATPAQWAQRPPVSAFQNTGLCASRWFDYTWDHCDYSDASSGYLGSGPTGGPPPASNSGYSETWLVRVHVASFSGGFLREAPAIQAPAPSEGDPRTLAPRAPAGSRVPSGRPIRPGARPRN